MRVSLEKHGGLAAGIRQPPYTVECSALPEPKKAELSRLVAAIEAAPPIDTETPGHARDAMTITISVDGDGKSTVFRQTDVEMSEAFANLLTWIERHLAETSR